MGFNISKNLPFYASLAELPFRIASREVAHLVDRILKISGDTRDPKGIPQAQPPGIQDASQTLDNGLH